MKTLICKKCKKKKTLDGFPKQLECKLGVSSVCKKCRYTEQKKRRKDNPALTQQRRRAYYAKNKEHINRRNNQWRKENKERCRMLIKANHKKLRNMALDVYGGKCANCGIGDREVLAIDHIGNDGASHRREGYGYRIDRWLRANNYPDGFQILCHNCNWKKHLRALENEEYETINKFKTL